MRATNQKVRLGMLGMLMAMFNLKGSDNASGKAIHAETYGYGSPIFIPRYHTKQSYRSQQRDAKKKRRAR